MQSVQDTFKLVNGVSIPCVGFGTWRTPDGEVAVSSVEAALDAGYRHIDTAAAYGNEKSVGIAIKKSGIPRKDIFVTSKLHNTDHGYENTLRAFEKTLAELDMDYLDLYLIHWPNPIFFRERWKEANAGSWKAFEELYNDGKIKAIGVSNFLEHHLEALLESATIAPMVDQLELHPQYVQRDAVNYCKDHRMIIEAWSPLIRGRLDHPLLHKLAEKYNKTPAQILLRWSIQHGFLPLPKASSAERMKENADIFDFELSEEDIEKMKVLEEFGRTGAHPDTAEF